MASDDAVIGAATLQSNGQIVAAQAAAEATRDAAETSGQFNLKIAGVRTNADVNIANIETTHQVEIAQIQSGWQTSVANIRANADRDVAHTGANAQVQSAQITSSYQATVANIRVSGDEVVAQTQANAEQQVANIRSQSEVQVENLRGSTNVQTATIGLTGSKYSSDRQLDGVNVHESSETYRLNTKLAWADARWNDVFPLIQAFFGGDPSSGSDAGTMAGRWQTLLEAVGLPPQFGQLEVLTPAQVQQQLNGVYAQIDGTVATKSHTAQMDLASRGFASASPIMDALRMGYEIQGISSRSEMGAKFRIDAARENTDMLLKSRTAAAEVYTKLLDSFVELEKTAVSLQVGILQASASLLGGVV